ncbi:hypothetical protein FNF29_05103 [Cafeteria roenbergensis]|uniref:Kinesin motor domain-containing protein n=2 Tax=Cafeteria roenbergensis TaxID=33653 RepID=A0A5A8CCY2_CAFRO|nr:hypothetical protein FNF29_05103 [Cafeteria roenbergensis]|eukprot:KAA0150768.1 hypothetical protein FNF29_05103 [Cafeteria roenbergensis]
MAAAPAAAAAAAASTAPAATPASADDSKSVVPVRVVVRARPLSSSEQSRGEPVVIAVKGNRVVVRNTVGKATGAGSLSLDKAYAYDKAYNQFAKQSEVFDECAMPVIEEVLLGYSATIFAYGQTGTGKTFTMEGEMSDGPSAGIIPRSITRIFERLEARSASEDEFEYSVRLSFLEVYNEQLFDLFGSSADDLPDDSSAAAYNPRLAASRKPAKASERLKLVEDSRKGLVKVQNLEEVVVHSAEEAFERVKTGLAKRQVAETKCNAFSSRSHGIFTLQIHSKEKTVEGEDLIRVGKLFLVDLAGSENVGRSGAKDKRLREAGNINQSLLTLGRVITALVEQRGHVPYRDSKLTRLLRDSLGGRTKTTIIATVSPSACSIEETLSTLDYALRARSIKNRPEANQRMTKRQLLRDFSTEIDHLRSMLQAARDKDGVYLPAGTYEEITNARASAEMQLEELKELHAVHEEEAARMQEELASLSAEVEALTARAEEAEASLEAAKEDIEAKEGTIAGQEAVIEGQEAAHRELAQQAGGALTQAVTEAAEDVAGLRAKVARQARHAREVQAGVSGVQASLDQALEAVAADAEATSSQRADEARSAAAAMRAAAAAAAEQADAAVAALNEARIAAVAAGTAVADSSSAAAAESASAWSAAADAATGPGAAAVSDAASAAATAVQSALDRAEAASREQAAVVAAWAERAAASAEASAAAWEAFANSHTAAIARCRDRAVAGIDAAGAALRSQADASAAFAAERASAEEALLSNVQTAVAKLVSDAFAEIRSAREAASEGSQAAARAAAEEAASAGKEVRMAAAGLAAKASEAARSGAGAARAEAKAAVESAEASVAAGEQVAEALCGEDAGSASSAAAAGAASVSDAVSRMAGAVAVAARQATERDAEAAGAVGSAAKASAAAVDRAVAEQTAAVAAAARAASEALASGASASAASADAAAAFGSHVSGWAAQQRRTTAKLAPAVAAPAPTGATPAKRAYMVPRALAAPSPRARVVARVEARRAAGADITPTVARSREAAARAAEMTPVRMPDVDDALQEDSPREAADAADVRHRHAASPPPVPSSITASSSPGAVSRGRPSEAASETSTSAASVASGRTSSVAGSLGRLISKVPSSASILGDAAAAAAADSGTPEATEGAGDAPRRPARRGRTLGSAPRSSRRGSSRSTSRASERTTSTGGSRSRVSGIPAPGSKRPVRRAARAATAALRDTTDGNAE